MDTHSWVVNKALFHAHPARCPSTTLLLRQSRQNRACDWWPGCRRGAGNQPPEPRRRHVERRWKCTAETWPAPALLQVARTDSRGMERRARSEQYPVYSLKQAETEDTYSQQRCTEASC
ncbi:hypothetical protein AAFF_G00053860 [Aldrovandia affinis]|uniref:Uncharacterized protein n=1 Tax=Aldrovandia affinis TaxID=143900 RepID=A0AAD7S1G7_9TELE|nr:hypothetical protein AAFF_G00053860 [Aldrovandia affinis]